MTTSTPVTEAGSRLLADSYTLFLKSHNYHWNVTGPMFHDAPHPVRDPVPASWRMAVDEIAERIRTLGAPAPGSYSRVRASWRPSKKAKAETPEPGPWWIEQLTDDQAAVARDGPERVRGGRGRRGPGERRPGRAPDRRPREERLDAAESPGVAEAAVSAVGAGLVPALRASRTRVLRARAGTGPAPPNEVATVPTNATGYSGSFTSTSLAGASNSPSFTYSSPT